MWLLLACRVRWGIASRSWGLWGEPLNNVKLAD
jgi:hypothetical protein